MGMDLRIQKKAGENVNELMEVQQNMLVTLFLSLALMAALFLMIFAAVALVQAIVNLVSTVRNS